MHHVTLGAQTVATTVQFLGAVDWVAVGTRVAYAVGGAFFGLMSAYFVLARDVSYIKGRVDQLTDHGEELEAIKIEIGILKGTYEHSRHEATAH